MMGSHARDVDIVDGVHLELRWTLPCRQSLRSCRCPRQNRRTWPPALVCPERLSTQHALRQDPPRNAQLQNTRAFLASYLPLPASILDQGNRLSLLPCTGKIGNHGFQSFGAYVSPRPDLGVEHGGLRLCCVPGIKRGAPAPVLFNRTANSGLSLLY